MNCTGHIFDKKNLAAMMAEVWPKVLSPVNTLSDFNGNDSIFYCGYSLFAQSNPELITGLYCNNLSKGIVLL